MGRHIATFVGLAHHTEQTLADSLRLVAGGHGDDPDTVNVCTSLARLHDGTVQRMQPIVDRYGEEDTEEPERLRATALEKTREGGAGMLRDLQDLYLLAALLQTTWTVLEQAAQGARDTELHQITQDALTQVKRTTSWLTTHLKAASPQVLLVGP